jgi:hypothetical protein
MPVSLPVASLSEQEPTSELVQGDGPAQGFQCDSCGKWFDGEPGGAGLFLWTRGEEVRYEEPPLCEECAAEISVGALVKWESEEEEEG